MPRPPGNPKTIKSVNLDIHIAEWVRENGINLSALVNKLLEREMGADDLEKKLIRAKELDAELAQKQEERAKVGVELEEGVQKAEQRQAEVLVAQRARERTDAANRIYVAINSLRKEPRNCEIIRVCKLEWEQKGVQPLSTDAIHGFYDEVKKRIEGSSAKADPMIR